MIRLGALLMASTLATSGCEGHAASPPSWSADTQAAADGSTRFGTDLYSRLREKPGSRFVSPYSIHTVFALLSGGARGATREELAKVLHLPADPDKALAVGDLGRLYAVGGKGYEISVANSLWGQQGYPWDDAYLRRADERFGAGLQSVDFKGNPEGGRSAVNKWVQDRTRDRIKDLLPAGSVTPLTRLVLANAIYFKGKWANPFRPEMTQNQPFTAVDGHKAPVPLMTRQGKYKHAKLEGFQILELPYVGGELAMDVILPTDHKGLPVVEDKLGDLTTWLGNLTDEPQVQVHLPKFKVEDQVDLLPVLKAMGLSIVFDAAKADLTGLVSRTPEDNLYVSGAYHKAFVEVAEEGTEAAAATGVIVATRSAAVAPVKPIVFRADRPFLFLIRDVKHGTVLFMGRYVGPVSQ